MSEQEDYGYTVSSYELETQHASYDAAVSWLERHYPDAVATAPDVWTTADGMKVEIKY